jgi:hypothetical protein
VNAPGFAQDDRSAVWTLAGSATRERRQRARFGLYGSSVAFAYSDSCSDGPVVDRTPWRFDLGAALGAGSRWTVDFGVLELELRYTRSLLDVERDGGGKTTNHAIYLVGRFGIGLGT